MDNKPISIQNVNGNVTITIVEGNNNKTEVTIGDFIEKTNTECGLRLIYEDNFKESSNTISNFNEWLRGFSFDLKSVYHEREYRREKIIDIIKKKLDDEKRLLLLGESGMSKTIFLMEILSYYLKQGYKIFHNIDSTASGEIKKLEYLENTISLLVQNGNSVLIIVDNVHNKPISNIFSLIQKIKNDHEDKLDKIRFLLSARQPEFKWAMDRGIFDSQIIEKIDILFGDEEKRYSIPYFTENEVKGFIEKYKEHLHPSKRNKSIEENAHKIYEDTEGYPIMVRFSVLQNGLKSHVKRMYTDYLIQNNSPNIERIKSVIACSLYDISSLPITDNFLCIDLDLETSSLEIVDTIIKRKENFWTTIHPRWDIELFKYMFSLNEADQTKIKKAFSFIIHKILEIQGELLKSGELTKEQKKETNFSLVSIIGSFCILVEKIVISNNILDEFVTKLINKDLSTDMKSYIYSNILAPTYIALKSYDNVIEICKLALKINNKNPNAWNNIGIVLYEQERNFEKAIKCYDKAIQIDPNHFTSLNNKGVALVALNRYDEALKCYDESLSIEPNYIEAWNNKGSLYELKDQSDEAIKCYDKAIKVDPKFANAWFNKGNLFANLGNYSEAIKCYDKAIKIKSNYYMAWYYKGIILGRQDNTKEALECYNKVLSINIDNTEALFNRARMYVRLNDVENALNDLEMAIKIGGKQFIEYVKEDKTFYNIINKTSRFKMIVQKNL